MKQDNINYVMVGSFVLIVLAAFFVVLVMITGRTGLADKYYVIYDNVAGIKFGTLVSYEGYHVGQVENIDPVQDSGKTRYKVAISVNRRSDGKRWNIPSDSVARVVADGFLAVISIDIKEGVSTTFYRPEEEVRGAGGKDMFGAFAELAAELSDLTTNGVKPLLESVSKSVRTVAGAAESTVPELLKQLESISKRLNASAEQVNLLVGQENRLRVESFLQRLDTSLGQLDKLLNESTSVVVDNKAHIEQSVRALRYSLQMVSQHISEITSNLETTSRNMTELSRQVRQNPSLLLGSEPPKDTVRETQ